MEILQIIIIAIAVILGLTIIIAITGFIKRIERKASGIFSMMRHGEIIAETSPRSLSSMEQFLIPKIMKDFPEYNNTVILDRVKKDAKLYYESAKAGRALYTAGISNALRDRLDGTLSKTVVGEIFVHKAVLHAYDSISRDRAITFQAAAKYRSLHNETKQCRLTLKYLAAYSDNIESDIRDFNCPNCGAPIPSLGEKVCLYCGTALKVSAGLRWVLVDITED